MNQVNIRFSTSLSSLGSKGDGSEYWFSKCCFVFSIEEAFINEFILLGWRFEVLLQVHSCYWPNVCDPPRFVCWDLILNMIVFGGGLCEVICSLAALMNSISILIKRGGGMRFLSLFSTASLRTQRKVAICKPGRVLSPDPGSVSTLILDSPASRTVRNTCLLFKLPVCGQFYYSSSYWLRHPLSLSCPELWDASCFYSAPASRSNQQQTEGWEETEIKSSLSPPGPRLAVAGAPLPQPHRSLSPCGFQNHPVLTPLDMQSNCCCLPSLRGFL